MESKNWKMWMVWLVSGIVITALLVRNNNYELNAIEASYLKQRPIGEVINDEQNTIDEQAKQENALIENTAQDDSAIVSRKQSSDVSETDSELEIPKKEKSRRGVIMLTGDLMCLRGQQYAAYKEKTYDFSDTFSYLARIFHQADFVVGNLETLISPSNPYSYQQTTVDGQPNCNAMYSYLEALTAAGFDAVITANNHCLDGARTGLSETIENLDRAGILHTGTFIDENQQRFLLTDINGIKVAILSYTELINKRNSVPQKELASTVRCYSQENVQADVTEAKALGAEFIIAFNHWGTENIYDITNQQQLHAQEMADAGVDLIAGTHSHCIQPPEYIIARDGRTVLCVYSLGNLVSSMEREMNLESIVLRIELEKLEGKVITKKIDYYPLRVFPSYGTKHYTVVHLEEEDHTREQFQEEIVGMNLTSQLQEEDISPALKKKSKESLNRIQEVMGDLLLAR